MSGFRLSNPGSKFSQKVSPSYTERTQHNNENEKIDEEEENEDEDYGNLSEGMILP